MKFTVYLRTTAMPYIGEPLDSPVGLAITLGDTEREIDYDEYAAGLNLNALADSLKVPRGSLTIITPEEYAAEYGED